MKMYCLTVFAQDSDHDRFVDYCSLYFCSITVNLGKNEMKFEHRRKEVLEDLVEGLIAESILDPTVHDYLMS